MHAQQRDLSLQPPSNILSGMAVGVSAVNKMLLC